MVAFGRAQLLGELDFDARVEVATRAGGAEDWHAFAAEAELFSVLGEFRELEHDSPIDGRDFDFAAKHRIEHRHGDVDQQVVSLAFEAGMGEDGHEEEEVSRAGAARARMALAGDTDARARLDARGNTDLEAAGRGRGIAGGDGDGARGAAEGLLEGNLDGGLDIDASAAKVGGGAVTAEDGTEDGAEVEVAETFAGVSAEGALLAGPPGGGLFSLSLFDLVCVLPTVAVFVVFRSLFGVRKDLEGGVDLFEAGLGRFVVGSDIGVKLAGEAAVSRANLLFGGVGLYAKDFVEAAGHRGQVNRWAGKITSVLREIS